MLHSDLAVLYTLPLSDDTINKLKIKHLIAVPADEPILLTGEIPFFDPIMFNEIDESSIARAVLKTKGAAGPSGINSDGWRRMLLSKNFGKEGTELRKN